MTRNIPPFPYEASAYQEKIFDFALHGNGNGVISARAGCGKTSVLTYLAQLVHPREKCVFLAFNKNIAEELTEKLMGLPNVSVYTAHSLGLAMLQRNAERQIEVDEYKYRSFIKTHIFDLTGINEQYLRGGNLEQYIDRIISLVDFARFNRAQTVKEISDVAIKYSVTVNYDECAVVKKCLDWGLSHTDVVDYTDMIWLPVELAIQPRGLQFDWVFHDECQDASLVMFDLIKKTFRRGTRFIAAGDPFQSIYAFAGADECSFENICSEKNTTIFELPISYRCGKSIIRKANTIVPDITACEDAVEGEVREDCPITMIKDGDMVLARNKAPLVMLYGQLLDKDKRAYIKGSDIGNNLIKLLDTVEEEELNASLKKDGVFVQLYKNMFAERDKLMETRGIDFTDATLSAQIMEWYDTITTLEALSKRYFYKEDLITHIRSVFKDDSEGVCLSTIHKAKGLENERVFIICASAMPSALAKRDWEIRQEGNLIYVAYTRAKSLLGFVSEKDLPPSGKAQDPRVILSKLENIEWEINTTLGTDFIPRRYRTNENIQMTKPQH